MINTLKKSDKAPEIVLKLSEMMRYTMKETQSDFVPLEEEINYINNYIELQKLRLDRKIKFDIDLIKWLENRCYF